MNETLQLQELYIWVDSKMQEKITVDVDDKVKKVEIEDRLNESFLEFKRQATEGSSHGREFTRNRILFLLKDNKDLNDRNIDTVISQYFIDYFSNLYTGGRKENIKKPIDNEIEIYLERFSISRYDSYDKKLFKLAQILYQELYGYSILDELIFDTDLNEVACNRWDYIWIQYKGIKRKVPNDKFKFQNDELYKRIVEDRMTSTAGEEINRGNPIVYSILRNGYRVTAAKADLCRDTVINVRLLNYKNMNEDIKTRFLSEKMEKLIEISAKKGRRNIAIIGEQGSGKTTAADELIIKKLDDDISIGLIENRHELGISRHYPLKNVVELQYVSQFTPSDLTEMMFRFNRDIIIYGEIRSASEAFEMIKSMLRQARGSLFTFHSSSVRRTIHDLRCLLMQSGMYSDFKTAQFDAADAIDLIIQLKLDRDTGERFVARISEVCSSELDMSYLIRDLFSYDKEKKKYLVSRAGLSKSFLVSCKEYELDEADAENLEGLFMIKEFEKDLYEYDE